MGNDLPQRYVDLSDDELVQLSKSGAEEAAVTLIVRYLPLVRSRAGFYASGNESFEDLCQEGTIGLLSAVRSYDAGKAAFSTFARLCIDRVLISNGRSNSRKKRIPDASIIQLNGEDAHLLEESIPADTHDPESLFIQREDYLQLLHKMAKTLSPLENRVLSLYVSGVGYGEIAKRLNLSTKSVDNALQRIRRKMK